MEPTSLKTVPKVKTRQGILHWARQILVMTIVFGAILFLAAGKINWTAGWVYLAMNALTQALSAVVLIPRQPDMLAERSEVREGTKGWDRLLAPLIVIFGTLAVIITAGLDARFGWSAPLSSGLWIASIILAFGCQMFVLWAMASNPYFAATVRIQADRGQSVTRSGPYGFVRHPGYLGSVVYNLAIPLVLGSLWTFIPGVLVVILLFVRTALEDRTLQAELPGYREYAANVRYRLIPGVW